MTYGDVFILGIILGGCGLFYFLKYKKRLTIRKKLAKARKGEARAIHFLENQGYTIASVQEQKTITTWIDGEPHQNQVKADLIAKKDGQTYLVEVKTGDLAPRPNLADTRRQLLEYYLAYRPDGILLLNMSRKELHTVAFAVSGTGSKKGFKVIAAIIIGVNALLAGLYLSKHLHGGYF